MKPLIMILLATIVAPVYGQSLADIARRERERRAQLSSNRAISTDTLDRSSAPAPATPAPATPSASATSPASTSPSEPATSPAPATPAAKPAEPVVDPLKQWQEETAKIRARARDLQDRENTLQIQLNDLNNQFFAPVTDQSAKSQAEAKITDTQKQLDDVRRELAETRSRIQQMDLQGPPQR